MSVYAIQETVRVIDATLGSLEKEKIPGALTLETIRFVMTKPGVRQHYIETDPEFIRLTDRILESDDSKTSYRKEVKMWLRYPRWRVSEEGDVEHIYPTWEDIDVSEENMKMIKDQYEDSLLEVKFIPRILDGRVCFTPTTEHEAFKERLYEKFLRTKKVLVSDFDEDLKDIVPSGSFHSVIVNTEIVNSLDESELREFIEREPCVGLSCKNIKKTFSDDQSNFGSCLVVRVESEGIRDFIRRFNEKFQMNINPSLHITIGVVKRSLLERL